MMKRRKFSNRMLRLWISGGSLLVLGGCGLSDSQLAGILQSAVSTGLNALLSQLLTALVGTTSAV